MNVTPAYYLCSTGFATVESNFTTYALQTIKKQANKTGPNRLTLLASDKRNLSFNTFDHIRYTRFWLNFNVGFNILLCFICYS